MFLLFLKYLIIYFCIIFPYNQINFWHLPKRTLGDLLTNENALCFIYQWKCSMCHRPMKVLNVSLTNENTQYFIDQWKCSMFRWLMKMLNVSLTNEKAQCFIDQWKYSMFRWPMKSWNCYLHLLTSENLRKSFQLHLIKKS